MAEYISNFFGAKIDTDEITDLAITTGKIADNAVTTAKILDGNVTAAKMSQVGLKLIETATLTTATDYTFSTLGTAKKLLLVIDAANSTNASLGIQFNGDTGNNYSYKYLNIAGNSIAGATQPAFLVIQGNTIGYQTEIFIPVDARNGNHDVQCNTAYSGTSSMICGVWPNAAAITSIKIYTSAGTMTGYASLYEVSKT